ncbi:flagellar hook capping FlgD N-terminal domain-containing protein [Leptospira sp. GIMC2001]|uniref:flagellar hook capping FlgD N-terminal domain-containing protein n=1 Tax=Leptospira sp. GIMC2001 TaxID=1513297 RepID=UPI0004A5C581|nr:flagellar basal-body rod modification protein FlgD [Leptospira sp. GIMC2001]
MPNVESARNQYLNSDRNINIQDHLNKLEKEEKSGLKGIEIRESAKQLGKDDFLKLLITQLSSQDPTSPMKDQDFIAQMAQFSSLEQMKNISSGISRMEAKQAYSVVGKLISGPDLVTGDDVVGIAAAIFFDGEGKTYARVNGRTVDIEKINLISDPTLMENGGQKQAPQGIPSNQEPNVIPSNQAAPVNPSNQMQNPNPANQSSSEALSSPANSIAQDNLSEQELNPMNPKKQDSTTEEFLRNSINSNTNKNFPAGNVGDESIPGYRPLAGKNIPYQD